MVKIGDFVRTSKGIILKVENEEILQMLKFLDVEYGDIINNDEDVKKLIISGDVIIYKSNSFSIDLKDVREYRDARSGKKYLGVNGFGLEQVEILEILTKEQFKSNSYKVKEV